MEQKIDINLFPKQIEALGYLQDKITTQIYYGGAAGGGKTWLGSLWLIKMCLVYPGSRWAIARQSVTTLKKTTMRSFLGVASSLGLQRDVDYNYREHHGEVLFENGSEILLLDLADNPSDPDFIRLSGLELTGAWVDEGNEISSSAYNLLNLRIRYKLNEFELAPKILITSNPSKNWVYTDFYKPWVDGTLSEKKAFIQALPDDNPLLPEEYLKIINDSPQHMKDRYNGKWEIDDDTALISYDNILNVFTNTHVREEDDSNVRMYMSCDVALQGNDIMVIMIWRGLEVIHIETRAKCTLPELTGLITQLKTKYSIPNSQIVVDNDGNGQGVTQTLGNVISFTNNAAPMNGGNYKNLKTQCYYKLAEMLSANKIWISADLSPKVKATIISELEQIKYKPTEDTKLCIISKDEVKSNIKRSPDYSDAMMMAMQFHLKKTGNTTVFSPKRNRF